MFNKLISLTDGPVRYEPSGRGHLKMVNHHNPYSLMEAEFAYVRDTIIENQLQRGFEVATAFGISGLAAALGFKETGGKLVTMDAYIEEQYNDAGAYENLPKATFENADGYRSVMYLREKFEVQNHLEVRVGWSPDDVGTVIESVHGSEKLDYAFIDAGHFAQQILADVFAVAPYLADEAVVFFHDVYPDTFTQDVRARIKTLLGDDITVALEYPQGENLGFVVVNK